MILAVLIFLVSNLTPFPNVKVSVFTVADIDFLVFFNKNEVGSFPEISYTVMVVGSNELEDEKSTKSSIKNLVAVLLEEIWVFSGICRQ